KLLPLSLVRTVRLMPRQLFQLHLSPCFSFSEKSALSVSEYAKVDEPKKANLLERVAADHCDCDQHRLGTIVLSLSRRANVCTVVLRVDLYRSVRIYGFGT